MFPRFTLAQSKLADEQIEEFYKRYDYDIREFPLEVVFQKFTQKDSDGITEWFVPSYQRKHIWSDVQQARFIESLLINLPIPYVFVSDTGSEALIEIIDGSQRIRTIARFIQNNLALENLNRLDKLNGFRFQDLTKATQRRFLRKTLRTIELRSITEDSRRELFNRLNTGGTTLTGSEKRYGVRDGRFFQLVKELADSEKFHRLCPIAQAKADRREYDEFTLRFFAYANDRENFTHNVEEFLDSYLDRMNDSDFDPEIYRNQFFSVMDFVEKYFPHGFKKKPGNKSVPRIRFESLSVGILDAISAQPDLVPDTVEWAYDSSDDFSELTTSDASNSRPRLHARIEYVKNKLLESARG